MVNKILRDNFDCVTFEGFGTFINADSLEVMQYFEEESISHIITDPPYNLGEYSTGEIKLEWRSNINNDIAEWDKGIFKPETLLSPFKKILEPKGNIFAFTSYNLIGRWHETFDPHFDTFQYMAWHKTNPVPKIWRAGFLNSVELIIVMWNKGHTWNFINQKEMHNFIESPICSGKERLKDPKHPTQKPVKVLKHLLKIGTNEGDLVLDPFGGVGSTAIACFEFGRKFISIEKDKDFHVAAVRRFENALAKGIQSEIAL